MQRHTGPQPGFMERHFEQLARETRGRHGGLALPLVLMLWLLVLGCAGPKPGPAPQPRPFGDRMHTVLVAIDGVRWQDVFEGADRNRARSLSASASSSRELLPNLYRLIERHGCAVGAPQTGRSISASGPNYLSLPGYTEMFTGAAPVDCPDNECLRVAVPTIADDAAALESGMGGVAVITSWPKIELAASRAPERIVISAGRSRGNNLHVLGRYPETRRAYRVGKGARPAPGFGEFRPDRHTSELAVSYLERFQPRFLFVGLGETDEYAHQNDYAGYLTALTRADQMLGQLYRWLERAEQGGASTLLMVTSDHGRAGFVHHGAAHPESARTWLVAAGTAVSARGFVPSPQARRLADLAPTIRLLWGLDSLPALSPATERRPGSVLSELFREL